MFSTSLKAGKFPSLGLETQGSLSFKNVQVISTLQYSICFVSCSTLAEILGISKASQ